MIVKTGIIKKSEYVHFRQDLITRVQSLNVRGGKIQQPQDLMLSENVTHLIPPP